MWIEDWGILGMISGAGLAALGGRVMAGSAGGSLRVAGALVALLLALALIDSAASAGVVRLFARG